MRILMVGALSIKYIRDSWVEPLKKMYPETVFIDVSPILSVYSDGFNEAYIARVIKKGDFDYLFFYADALNADFTDQFFSSITIPVITFYADDEPDIWFRQNEPYDHRFDLVATHSKRGLKIRNDMGKVGNFIYLPWGFNPDIFKPMDGAAKLYDMVYVGENLVSRNNPSVFLRDGKTREEALCRVFDICQRHGLTFKVFGAGWDSHPVLGTCSGGIITNDEMVDVYRQTKVVFNPGFCADARQDKYQTKLRHFEVPACGAFQLVNENPELAELFKEDEEIVFYKDSIFDLEEKILYYTKNDVLREVIGQKACLRAHSEHKIQDRLNDLFKHVQKLKGVSKTHYVGLPMVKSHGVSRNLVKYDNNFFVHFLPCITDVQDINYNLLNIDDCISYGGIIGKCPFPIAGSTPLSTGGHLPVGIRTFLELGFLHKNRIQRKKENLIGIILNERVEKCLIDPFIIEYIRKSILCLETDRFIIPLFNYLVPEHYIDLVLEIFYENNLKAFEAIEPFNTGLIVNDFVAQKGELPKSVLVPAYIKMLDRVFRDIKKTKERVLLYGGRGTMADNVFTLLQSHDDVNVLGVVDRSLEDSYVSGYPVYKFEDIDSLGPDFIVICAGNSGSKIYESIKHLSSRVTILPLYDLNMPVWKVLLY